MVAATIAAGYLLLPLAASALVRLLSSMLNASVWLAAAIGSGSDMWTIVSTVGRTTARALTTPVASGIVVALLLVGALALIGLRRLLGSEEDSSQ